MANEIQMTSQFCFFGNISAKIFSQGLSLLPAKSFDVVKLFILEFALFWTAKRKTKKVEKFSVKLHAFSLISAACDSENKRIYLTAFVK